MLRASQEADLWILGKTRTCLSCGGGEAAGDTVEHLRGFSVFISAALRRKPLTAEVPRAAVAWGKPSES